MATDLAEFIGAALGFKLLLGISLLQGAVFHQIADARLREEQLNDISGGDKQQQPATHQLQRLGYRRRLSPWPPIWRNSSGLRSALSCCSASRYCRAEVVTGGNTQLGRHQLDQHRHNVGPYHHPQQFVAWRNSSGLRSALSCCSASRYCRARC
jgi:hypothetical protein